LRSLGNLNVKIIALNNELNMISKLSIFKTIIHKPHQATIKLIRKMESSETGLRTVLNDIRSTLVSEYNELITNCESVENQLNSHVKRLLTTS